MHKAILHARRLLAITALVGAAVGLPGGRSASGAEERRLLYVATPGIRNYLEYGGHGLLVFDIDDGHRFVKRIPTAGLDEHGKPLNVKGVCARRPRSGSISAPRRRSPASTS